LEGVNVVGKEDTNNKSKKQEKRGNRRRASH
jgi:hypothetical protein